MSDNQDAVEGDIIPPNQPSPLDLPAVVNKGELAQNAKVGAKTRAALAALVSGEATTLARASEIAGMAHEQLSRNLKKPHVSAFLDTLRKNALQINTTRAEAELSKLTVSARSEYVRLEAASRTVERYDKLNALVGRGVQTVHFHIDLA